jgi:alkylresorcinol/alkylpyrone synthase
MTTRLRAAETAPSVQAVTRTLPDHYCEQEEFIDFFKKTWATRFFNLDRLEELHRKVNVSGRHLAVPLSQLEALDTFGKRNDAYITHAVDLGERAIRAALAEAGLTPRDVDHIFFVSITGLATPSIDALLVNRLGLRADVKRTPIFGLGCLAGAAGLARAADYLRAFPDEVAILLSVELCVLTHQKEDLSIANIIASGLFGDGAAAAVLVGAARAEEGHPRVLTSRSSFYPDTEKVMGWEIGENGFRVVLSPAVPDMVRKHFRADVDGFLSAHGLERSEIAHWVLHTGGPKVLDAFSSTLELPEGALARTWDSLQRYGNLSSASVLFVLSELIASGEATAGDYGVLAAMGPGFCAELVLLQQ